jgi:hypothetical protein
LSFLWKAGTPNETDINSLRDFLPNNQEEINAENYGDIVSEFRSDYICALSYLKAF